MIPMGQKKNAEGANPARDEKHPACALRLTQLAMTRCRFPKSDHPKTQQMAEFHTPNWANSLEATQKFPLDIPGTHTVDG